MTIDTSIIPGFHPDPSLLPRRAPQAKLARRRGKEGWPAPGVERAAARTLAGAAVEAVGKVIPVAPARAAVAVALGKDVRRLHFVGRLSDGGTGCGGGRGSGEGREGGDEKGRDLHGWG